MRHRKPSAAPPRLDSRPAAIDPAAASLQSSPQTQPPTPATLPEPEFGFSPPEHYDPAEYRWVPVRRRARRDGWTEEKQRRFIEVLADTGLVGVAAREVGMTRTAAYKLRRAPHAAAFARAWDLARERAGALIEDVAFERALEGVETEVYDRSGALTGSKTIYNDRLLTFLLRHLKPERYGSIGQMARSDWRPGADAASDADGAADAGAPDTLDAALRAMEPRLPAPAEALFAPEALSDALLTAEIGDGALPHFLAEGRLAETDDEERAADLAARRERGRAMDEALDEPGRESMSAEDLAAWCLYHDPSQANEMPRKLKRKR